MAMSSRFRKKVVVFLMLHQVMRQTIAALLLVIAILEKKNSRKRIRSEASEAYVAEDGGGDGDNEGNSPQSVNNYDAPQTESKSAKKKRKTSDSIEALYEMVGELVANTNKLKDIAKFIGYEFSLGQKRENIFSLLSSIPDLDDFERYDLCDVIAKDSGRLEMFFGLPMEHRGPYVRRLLDRLGDR